MIKRETIILYILIAAVFFICGAAEVNADGSGQYHVYVNDSKLDSNIVVQSFNGFDYIPVNRLQAALSFSMKEDKAAQALVFVWKDKTIKITKGINTEINGVPGAALTVPIIMKDSNHYLPIISAVDLFGWQVEVLDDIRCIRIKTSPNAAPAGKIADAELYKQNRKETLPKQKVAYLTFDDGLDSRVTPLVLDILKQNDIKATFFILGKSIEKNLDLLKRMVDEGHSVGNHTYTHIKANIYSSAAGLKSEIDKTNTAIYNAVGITPKLFRPPYGGTYIRKDMFSSVLAPYRTVLWNVDSMDSRSTSVSSYEIVNSVKNQVKNKKSAIIIMHDSGTHMETVKALPEIIKYLRDNGFIILPIDENTDLYYEY